MKKIKTGKIISYAVFILLSILIVNNIYKSRNNIKLVKPVEKVDTLSTTQVKRVFSDSLLQKIDINRKSVKSDLSAIASDALKYYNTQIKFGGGGRSFEGYSIPQNLASNENGIYTISTPGTVTGITIQGIGVEPGETGTIANGKICFSLVVSPNSAGTHTKIN